MYTISGKDAERETLSFEGRHLFDSPNKPAAKRSAAVIMGHDRSFGTRIRVQSSPESVYVQAGISVHFKPE